MATEQPRDSFTTTKSLVAPAAAAPQTPPTPSASEKPVFVVKANESCYDDDGKLREKGDIFVTTRAELIGREVSDATRTAQSILDEDQKAILKLAKR